MTYCTPDRVDGSNTMGGYSDSIVVSEHFVVKIPAKLDLASAAPIMPRVCRVLKTADFCLISLSSLRTCLSFP